MTRIVGVDIGGTFTDLILYDSSSRAARVHKVPTTNADPSIGMMTGISELCEANGLSVGELDAVLHATTIATNAMLEYKGVKTGFITTGGFRDVLHIGRHQRPQHYSIMQDIPWQARPLVRRRYRRVVTERIVPPGEVDTPLNEAEVMEAIEMFRREGVESVGIGFINAYLNPAHERQARALVERELPDVFVTTSSDLCPQFREFERFTTAAINAFIGPKVARYLRGLERRLADNGFRGWLHLMMSNGGVATVDAAAERPVTLLLSGPAAGVLGGAWSGIASDRNNLITFDMGGTSADIGIVDRGEVIEAPARDTWIAGYPVLMPMLDVHTIGAGGGSIAYRDEGGAFRVGPRSAGAQPGPACYDRGGVEPTVTDAHVVLGRIDPSRFLGGEMRLNVEAARTAIAGLGDSLGLGLTETAEGIITIANNEMAAAIRSRTLERGRDPRQFTLVAFGGAGPLHAAEVAEILDIPEVLIPAYPGINSAVGLLTTDLRYDRMVTVFKGHRELQPGLLGEQFEQLEDELRARLEQDGVASADITLLRGLDCRYVGQGYEMRVRVDGGTVTGQHIDDAMARFHDAHKREYGHSFPGDPVEVVNLRVSAIGRTEKMNELRAGSPGTLADARLGGSTGLFRTAQGLQEVPIAFYDRWRLPIEEVVPGACVVYQRDTTVLVPPGWTVMQDQAQNLILRRGGEGRS